MISGQKYSGPQADVWSLGVILYTFICGYLPFDDDNDVMIHKKIVNLEYDLPDFLSDVSKDLITRILKIDFRERITIPDILAHPWFRDDVTGTNPPPILPPKPLGSTPEEAALITKLDSAGFDVAGILTSVRTNACDQASALWYLLLQKERGAQGTNGGDGGNGDGSGRPAGPGENATSISSSTIVDNSIPSPPPGLESPLGSPSLSKSLAADTSGFIRPADVEKYLLESARVKNGGAASPVNDFGGHLTTAGGGRRGMMMEAMRGNVRPPSSRRGGDISDAKTYTRGG
ncbi:hypothetical protein HK104_007673, partial [Borealophlyctis nickersoniae]